MPTAWAFGKSALPRIVFIVALRAGSASPRLELLIDRRVVGKRKKGRSGSSQSAEVSLLEVFEIAGRLHASVGRIIGGRDSRDGGQRRFATERISQNADAL
jgi:hypothetical protein